MRGHEGVTPNPDPAIQIVLVEPEIPGNTGAIGRLAMATRSPLHLVEPLGFAVDDRHLRRAGLDYWRHAEVYYHDSFDALLAAMPDHGLHLLSAHGEKLYTEIPYRRGDLLVFGGETRGLPAAIREAHTGRCYRIPLWNDARSLNLSNAAAIVTYEGLRQLGAF